MERLTHWVIERAAGERGQDMVEYALVSGFLAVAVVLVTLGVLNSSFTQWANNVASCVADPIGSCGF